MSEGHTRESMTLPDGYEQFPELTHLCQAREIRNDYAVSTAPTLVSYCQAIALEGEDWCKYHKGLREQCFRTGNDSHCSGFEIRLPIPSKLGGEVGELA